MTDFSTRRVMMVDTQIRPSDVTKFPIIEAMLTVPRESYVPADLREAAYMSENVAIGPGRVMLEPRTFAKMLDALNIQPTEAVLDLGCGLGYSTAVIARLAATVVAVEEEAVLAAEAERNLAAAGASARVVVGPLTAGAPAHGPYDVITVEGGVENVPEALLGQLKDGGRICCLFMEGALGVVRIGYRIDDCMTWRPIFNASAPVLPGFALKRQFVL